MKYIGKWDKERQEVVWYSPDELRPKEAFHYVVEDTMQPLEHPATGRICDSKSAFRRITKENGCVELGNDKVEKPKYEPKGLDEDIRRVIGEFGL